MDVATNSNHRHILIENETGVYDGEVNDKYLRHGYGIYKWKKTGDKYEGYWSNNLRCGKGEYLYNDGSIYRGEWMNDLKNGKGSYKFNNFEFDGEWENDHITNGFVFKINKFEFKENRSTIEKIPNMEILNTVKNDDENLLYTNKLLQEKIKENYEKLFKLREMYSLNIEVKNYKKKPDDSIDYVFDTIIKYYDKVKIKQPKGTHFIPVCNVCCENTNSLNKDVKITFNSFNCNCQKIVNYLRNYMNG